MDSVSTEMTSVRVIVTKFHVECEELVGKGKFTAVAQPIPGTVYTSLPVYLP